MTAHLTYPNAIHVNYAGSGPGLVDSARYEQPHTRALRLGLEKYGPTPIYDALAASPPTPPRRRTRKERGSNRG